MPDARPPRSRCEACNHQYDPDPYNAHHQKYCRRPGCLRRRRRERQRIRFRRRYREDADFRDEERRRARERKKRRREEAPPARPPGPDRRDLVIMGMAAHLADSRDPRTVNEILERWAGWGLDVAGAEGARAPPSF